MRELGRIYGKKTLLFLAVLCVVNFALFLFSAAPDKEITLSGEELAEYVASYPAFLERTAESSRVLATLDMYKNGYAYEVLKKSEAVYRNLADVSPAAGENTGLVLLLQYQVSDLFLLAFLLIVAAESLAERRKGLAGMVRSTDRGRGDLYIQRIAILAFSAVLGAALLYAGDLAGLRIAFGKCDMSRYIQSLPEFMLCPYHITIREYLFLSIAIKAAGCLLAAIIFLLLISVLNTLAAYVVAGGLVLLELLLHLTVGPVSALNALRYLNLYTIISCREYFEDYCLIDLFGKAVPAMAGVPVMLGVLSAAAVGAGLFIHGRLYVTRRRFGERFADKLAAFFEKFALQRTLAGWEGYKLFLRQGGIFLITAAFCLHLVMSMKYDYRAAEDTWTDYWYNILGGEMTMKSLNLAENEKNRLEREIAQTQETLRELRESTKRNSEREMALSQRLLKDTEMRDALAPILNNLRDGMRYTKRTGRTLTLMKPAPYDLLILRDARTRDRASLFTLVTLIGTISGIFAYDAENHMRHTMHTAYRGRGRTAAVKLGIVFACCVLASTAMHAVQMIQVQKDIGFHDLAAAVQSLEFMREFEPYVPIWLYFLMLFAVRAAAAFGVGLLVALVSRLCSDTVTAMGISAFLFVVPTAFAQAVPFGRYISAVDLLGGAYFR